MEGKEKEFAFYLNEYGKRVKTCQYLTVKKIKTEYWQHLNEPSPLIPFVRIGFLTVTFEPERHQDTEKRFFLCVFVPWWQIFFGSGLSKVMGQSMNTSSI